MTKFKKHGHWKETPCELSPLKCLFLPTVPGVGTVGQQMDFFSSFSSSSFSFSSTTTNFGGWVGLYCTVLCTVLYCTVLYCVVLYCTVLYCIVLYCTVLYCIVLYCTVLYCTVLYYTVTVLYCTVLYCTVQCHLVAKNGNSYLQGS